MTNDQQKPKDDKKKLNGGSIAAIILAILIFSGGGFLVWYFFFRNKTKSSPQGSPLGSPQGSPLGSPQGSPLGSPQGSPLGSPLGSEQPKRSYTPNDSPLGSPLASSIPGTVEQINLCFKTCPETGDDCLTCVEDNAQGGCLDIDKMIWCLSDTPHGPYAESIDVLSSFDNCNSCKMYGNQDSCETCAVSNCYFTSEQATEWCGTDTNPMWEEGAKSCQTVCGTINNTGTCKTCLNNNQSECETIEPNEWCSSSTGHKFYDEFIDVADGTTTCACVYYNDDGSTSKACTNCAQANCNMSPDQANDWCSADNEFWAVQANRCFTKVPQSGNQSNCQTEFVKYRNDECLALNQDQWCTRVNSVDYTHGVYQDKIDITQVGNCDCSYYLGDCDVWGTENCETCAAQYCSDFTPEQITAWCSPDNPQTLAPCASPAQSFVFDPTK